MSLFDDGVRILEERTGAPCFGVFPFADDIALDAEDSLALDDAPRTPRRRPARGSRSCSFPRLSNATDFRLLTWADWVVGAAGRRLRLRHPAGQQEHDGRSCMAARRRAGRLGRRRSIAAARRSLASAAGFRCSANRFGIRRASSRRRWLAEDSACCLRARFCPREDDARLRRRRRRAASLRRLRNSPGRDDGRAAEPIERRSRGSTTARPTACAAERLIGTYLHGALEACRGLRRGLRHRRRRPRRKRERLRSTGRVVRQHGRIWTPSGCRSRARTAVMYWERSSRAADVRAATIAAVFSWPICGRRIAC